MTTLPLSILFADPDLAATRPLRIELRRRGATVRLARTAENARRLAAAAPPDLVVLDESLCREGESDLLTFFRESYPDAEAILLHSGGDAAPHGPGQGLLFSAHKPVSKATLVDVMDSAFPGRLKADPAPARGPRTLLCVDDDRNYLTSLSRFLQRRGYQVSAHDTAGAALEALPRLRPELAIVDVLMPGMDGLALVRRIHEDTRGKVPVVVLTAHGSTDTRRQAEESGASYCLTKPCTPEDFLNVVDLLAGDLDEQERELLRERG